MAHDILKQLRFDSKTIETVSELVLYHDMKITDEKQLKRLLNRLGESRLKMLLEVKKADIIAKNPVFVKTRLVQLAKTSKFLEKIICEQDCYKINHLAINGEDIMTLGQPEGPAVGKILNSLLEMVIDGKIINNRTDLVIQTKKMIELIKNNQ